MNKNTLKPCPFCGQIPELIEYHETCDGRGDRVAKVVCECQAIMTLTVSEIVIAEEDFGYTGGYYSQNKKFWDGMHQRLIDKWNNRIIDISQKKFDEFERAGFSPDICEELRSVRDEYGIPSEYLINMLKHFEKEENNND